MTRKKRMSRMCLASGKHWVGVNQWCVFSARLGRLPFVEALLRRLQVNTIHGVGIARELAKSTPQRCVSHRRSYPCLLCLPFQRPMPGCRLRWIDDRFSASRHSHKARGALPRARLAFARARDSRKNCQRHFGGVCTDQGGFCLALAQRSGSSRRPPRRQSAPLPRGCTRPAPYPRILRNVRGH